MRRRALTFNTKMMQKRTIVRWKQELVSARAITTSNRSKRFTTGSLNRGRALLGGRVTGEYADPAATTATTAGYFRARPEQSTERSPGCQTIGDAA